LFGPRPAQIWPEFSNFPVDDPPSRHHIGSKKLLMIPRASRLCPRWCSKLCSSCPVSSGRHYWNRSRGRAHGRGRRPDVIAEQRRPPSSQLRTNITHRQGGGQGIRQPLPRLERCRLSSGATTVTVTSQATSERNSGILESHLATSQEPDLVHRSRRHRRQKRRHRIVGMPFATPCHREVRAGSSSSRRF
jgi:hypothetical protein